MDLSLTYYGRVTLEGVKVFRAKEMTEMILRNFAGKEIEITVRRKRKHRTLAQNAYYYGVVVPMVCQGLNDAGYKMGKKETHEFLKSTFNRKEIVSETTGEIITTVGSTAAMSTVEAMEYYAPIRQWAAEFLRVQIPEPNEQLNFELT